ncbi:heme NO-binding domain-containing protein [Jannaschia sp. W003]|uniref:heme NO-binding domain-containing protein n=1 Tax=Jannaschia sp. W003 TaxID=2867012 RepID=UPI0021A4243D|nr:heme NO-binding domain-containing protein [Jannaschia sp. W003]UWQ21040.1 heme NO-binding domain-containing protein [Jannaschia sp. W003]
MHGIICKTVETFLVSRHGERRWDEILRAAGTDVRSFETVRVYDAALLPRILAAASGTLGVPVRLLLEDMGHWLCVHPPLEPVRRLFRFSGTTFEEMLFGLHEVRARARMALPDLDMPALSLADRGGGTYRVISRWHQPGAAAVVMGILRAMADDYGALALVTFERGAQEGALWRECISVQLLAAEHQPPRSFSLGGAA